MNTFPRRFIKVLLPGVAILALGGFLWILASNLKHPNTTVTLQANWTFRPAGSDVSFPLRNINAPLMQVVPKPKACCDGTYHAELKEILQQRAKDLVDPTPKNPALYFPAVAGLEEIKINGQSVLTSSIGAYRNAGPVIALNAETLAENPNTAVSVKIRHPRAPFAGFYLHSLEFGEHEQLTKRREQVLFYQKDLALICTVIFIAAAFLVMSLVLIGNRREAAEIALVEVTLSWAAFYYALSGELRAISPTWGGHLHLPLRILAELTTIRLLLAASYRANSIKTFAVGSTLVGLVSSLILGFPADQKNQLFAYFYAAAVLMFVWARACIDLVRHNPKLGPTNRFIILAATLPMLSLFPDAYKIGAAWFFHIHTDTPYLNRYFQLPFVFGAVFYLVYKASRQTIAEDRAQLTAEIGDQILHDLRSPVVAIRNAAKHFPHSPEFTTIHEIIESATTRILSITRSFENKSIAGSNSLSKCDLQKVLSDLLAEKKIEHPGHEVTFEFSCDKTFISFADPNEFKRVISNLINNAIEASRSERRIEILLFQENSLNVIEIADSGSGMPTHIIESMGQSKITSRKDGGMGLGLFHANKCFKAWGGTLSTREHSPVGTIVTCSLPSAME